MNSQQHLDEAEDYALAAATHDDFEADEIGLTDGQWRTVEHYRAMATLHLQLALVRKQIPAES